MKIQIIVVVVVLCAITVNAFTHRRSERVKRSPDDSVIGKIKSGVGNLVGGVKNLGVKGYEEVKNLFSKNRRVGDYRLNQIDVRFGEDEEFETTTTTITDEIVAVNEENNSQLRDKREAKKAEIEMSDFQRETFDEQVLSQSFGIEASTRKSNLPNNAEESPGFPLTFKKKVKPLCDAASNADDGKCRIDESE